MFSIAILHQNIVPVFHTFFSKVLPSICNTVRFIVSVCILSNESPNSLTDFNLHPVKFTILMIIMDFDKFIMSCIHYYSIIQNSFITLKFHCVTPFSSTTSFITNSWQSLLSVHIVLFFHPLLVGMQNSTAILKDSLAGNIYKV